MTRARLPWGLAAVCGCAAVAVAAVPAEQFPVRVLFDGLAPPLPYRWVRPPPGAPSTAPPQPGEGRVRLTPTGSEPASVFTGDGQAHVTFPRDALAPREGEAEVEVRIIPRDPARLPPPPRGLRIDGNAYEVRAVYATSRAGARVVRAVQVVLRYPVEATVLLRLSGAVWRRIEGGPVGAQLQIYGRTAALGTFAAAGPPFAHGRGVPWWAWAAGAGGLAVGGAGWYLGARRRRSTRRRR